LVIGTREGSSFYKAATTDSNYSVCLRIPTLSHDDRAEMIRTVLRKYGKALAEKAFSNQMRLLISKRESDNPAFLITASHYLRLYATFDTVGFEHNCFSFAIIPHYCYRLAPNFAKCHRHCIC